MSRNINEEGTRRRSYAERDFKFETLQLHVGQEAPDPVTDARAVPIYQTSSFVFKNSAHAAARFALQDAGNIYGRLTNPTEDVFEQRMARLEGGVAALATASGAAAVTYTIQNLAQNGGHIVAAKNIYGGTYNLLAHTLADYGVTTTFVDPLDVTSFERAIQDNTKALYIETLGNPNSEVSDIEAVAKSPMPTICRLSLTARLRRHTSCARLSTVLISLCILPPNLSADTVRPSAALS